MAKQVFTRNTVSGQVGYVPESYLDHPVFSRYLEEVPEGTKPLNPNKHAEADVDGISLNTGKPVRQPKDQRTETEKEADRQAKLSATELEADAQAAASRAS